MGGDTRSRMSVGGREATHLGRVVGKMEAEERAVGEGPAPVHRRGLPCGPGLRGGMRRIRASLSRCFSDSMLENGEFAARHGSGGDGQKGNDESPLDELERRKRESEDQCFYRLAQGSFALRDLKQQFELMAMQDKLQYGEGDSGGGEDTDGSKKALRDKLQSMHELRMGSRNARAGGGVHLQNRQGLLEGSNMEPIAHSAESRCVEADGA